MKAFRGTLLAAVLLAAVAVAWFFLKPAIVDTGGDAQPRLFTFEKHELVRVQVERPGAETLALKEIDGNWTIDGTDFVAGRSMVNRVKHQIHDLTARASVVEDPELPELYGLGDNAIKVSLVLRDGRELSFLAGDPNPSSVSYYIQPLPGDKVYTVKKAAVDYYSLTLAEFRERRFASFDSKDATRIEATLDLSRLPVAEGESPRTGVVRLDIERTGDQEWEMRAPLQMAADDDRVKRLLGRVSALKARDFLTPDDLTPENPGGEIGSDKLREYGLDEPRADITVRFASRDPLRVLVGNDAPSDNKYEEVAYMLLDGDDTIYVARRGMLDEFGDDPADLRARRVVRIKAEDVVAVDAVLRADVDDDLEGQQGVRFAAERWFWKDGVPVPGSTPERVASTLAEMEAEAFVEDNPKRLADYGLEDPIARVVLSDAEGNERAVRIGAEGAPLVDPEGQERTRRYALVEGAGGGGPDPVYLVEDRVIRVVRDLIREGNRKAEKDTEKAERRERIPSVEAPEEAEGQR